MVGVDLTGAQLLEGLQVDGELFRMRDRAHAQACELVHRVAEHLGEAFVHQYERAVEGRERHADGRRVECAAEPRFALLHRAAGAGRFRDVLERDGHAAAREREGLEREHARRDAVVGVLDLASVEECVALDNRAEPLNHLFLKRREHLPDGSSENGLCSKPGRHFARRIRVLEPEAAVRFKSPDPQRGLHVLHDLTLRSQLLDEGAASLELGRVAHHGADELGHQPGRLDRELIERVRLTRDDREYAYHDAVAVKRRANQRPRLEDPARLRVDPRVRCGIGCVDRRAQGRGEAREACGTIDPKPDARLGDAGADADHGDLPVEPLHSRTVGAGQPLCALDDRPRDGDRIELERGDLLLRLDDRLQLVEARAEALIVALALRDVAERRVDSTVVEHAARVFDVDRCAVLAPKCALRPKLPAFA